MRQFLLQSVAFAIVLNQDGDATTKFLLPCDHRLVQIEYANLVIYFHFQFVDFKLFAGDKVRQQELPWLSQLINATAYHLALINIGKFCHGLVPADNFAIVVY